MKTTKIIFILFFIVVLFNSCMDEYTEFFTANSPVYLSYEELREPVKKTDPRDLVNPGKIYFKDGYIFINEQLEGIHIIDNRDPESPENIGFIGVPGNIDIVIKNNTLYADSYVDLVAINISDVNSPQEVNRTESVFPYTVPPYDENYRLAEVDEEKGVVIDWKIEKVRQAVEHHYYPVYYRYNKLDYAMNDAYSGGVSTPQGNTFGVGGSMARFGLDNSYLYAVDVSTLYLFDVTNDEQTKYIGSQNVGWNVETMFIYDGHMFLGTQTGMRVFTLDVATVPAYLGEFRHVTACDPVFVDGNYAYVTLRGGNQCGSSVNRLDVLQLSAGYKNSTLLQSYPMNGPYGLGIDDDILFVCDGDAGLKVYDANDKLHIDDHLIASFPDINTYDVIPVNGYLFMIGENGFYQYDYSDLMDIRQVSFIPVKQEN